MYECAFSICRSSSRASSIDIASVAFGWDFFTWMPASRRTASTKTKASVQQSRDGSLVWQQAMEAPALGARKIARNTSIHFVIFESGRSYLAYLAVKFQCTRQSPHTLPVYRTLLGHSAPVRAPGGVVALRVSEHYY